MTAYAEAVAQRMERAQEDVQVVAQQSVDASAKGANGLQNPTNVAGSSEVRRSSTPFQPGGDEDTEADLSPL